MQPLLSSVIASAALGALVGLIRQWRGQVEQPEKWDLGGVRTYTFWAMLGCLGAYAAQHTAPLVLAVLAALVGVQQIIAKTTAPAEARQGSTTFAASLLTFLVGCLTFWNEPAAAVLVAALTTVLLGSKPAVHGWTRALSRDDMRALLQFAAISGVILPLVPNQDMGPFRALNPFSIWLMVVLVSGTSFAGYLVMRLFGARNGILLTSFFGGLASSTASTLAFSRRSRRAESFSAHFELAVIVACTVMLPRLVLVTAVINAPFALQLITPLGIMAIPGIVFAIWTWRRRRPEGHDEDLPQIANPLGLATALKFGAIYAAVTLLVKAAPALGWTDSLLPLSFVSGLTDVDAISLSLAKTNANDEGMQTMALRGVVLAVISNTLLKAGIAVTLGSQGVRRWASIVLGVTAAFGVAWMVFPMTFNGQPLR